MFEWLRRLVKKPEVITEAEPVPESYLDTGVHDPKLIPFGVERTDPDCETDAFWTYSEQYPDIITEGDLNPPPSMGSPTFVWHMGLWPKRAPGEYGFGEDQNPNDLDDDYYNLFDGQYERFFEEISGFLMALQRRGRVQEKKTPEGDEGSAGDPQEDEGIEKFAFARAKPFKYSHDPEVHQFKTVWPHSMSLTLWWQDEASADQLNERSDCPPPSSIRVRVQVYVHVDHVTITFFIDPAQAYDLAQLRSGKMEGKRRHDIYKHLELIREVAEHQIKTGVVDGEPIPEREVPKEVSVALREASDYFYEGIWRDFAECFDMKVPTGDDGRYDGERFCDVRAVVMSAPECKTAGSEEYQKVRQEAIKRMAADPSSIGPAPANVGYGPFPVFDAATGEPNTVVKSLWPFMRRIYPWADFRDFVASGVFDWRAIYITPLGLPSAMSIEEWWVNPERRAERRVWPKVPDSPNYDGPQPTEDLKYKGFETTTCETLSEYPLRYLVVTKGEPQRAQIGRIVERLNALTTARLFAFRRISAIKNASVHIRLIGRSLDGALERWSKERLAVEQFVHQASKSVKTGRIPMITEVVKEAGQEMVTMDEDLPDVDGADVPARSRTLTRREVNAILRSVDRIFDPTADLETLKQRYAKHPPRDLSVVRDDKLKLLAKVISTTESKLIELGQKFDQIGAGGSGRLMYIINRSRYHTEEFKHLWPTLNVGNIDGFVSYETFVRRSVKPSFDYIESTGERLTALRSRLQEITNTIQTSALIMESEATRENTQILTKIFSTVKWGTRSAFVLIIVFSVVMFVSRYAIRG